MSEKPWNLRTHDNGNGMRVVIPLGNEEHVLTSDRARALADALLAVTGAPTRPTFIRSVTVTVEVDTDAGKRSAIVVQRERERTHDLGLRAQSELKRLVERVEAEIEIDEEDCNA